MNLRTKTRVSWIVAAVTVFSAVTALASCSSHADNRSADGGTDDDAGPDARSDGSAKTGSSGSATIAWNDGNFYLYGINYPWLNFGTDFGSLCLLGSGQTMCG